MGNFNIIELLLIAFAVYMGISKQKYISNKLGCIIVAACLLLILFLGPSGSDEDTFLTGFGLTVDGFNYAFLGAIAVCMYFITKRAANDQSVNGWWYGMAGVMLLTAGQSGLTF